MNNIIWLEVDEWDTLVKNTYCKPYSFQQQDDCQSQGTHYLNVPDEAFDFTNDSLPEEVNIPEMGVSFKAWLARDVNEPVGEYTGKTIIEMFWHRHFYPDLQTVANDLLQKGKLKPGSYAINIDW